MPHAAGRSRKGFTLLEVMIAVVILAVGLASLFTSEAASIRIAQRARTTTIATLLARCKMAEIEAQIAKEGWPGTDLDERDECCRDAEHDGYRCEWSVKRIVLPNSMDLEGGDGDTGKSKQEGALEKLKAAAGVDPGAAGSDPSAPAGATPGATPGATDPTQNMGIPLTGLVGAAGMGAGTGTGTQAESAVAADPIASMIMEFTFPVMKPVLEEQVRRATVTVKWKEGSKDHSFDVVQYLVNELEMLAADSDDDPSTTAPGQANTGGTSAPGTPGTSTGSTSTGSPSNARPGGG